MELMDEVNSILNSLHPLILREFLNTRENRELIDRSAIDFKHLWLRSEWTGIVNNAVFELYFIG